MLPLRAKKPRSWTNEYVRHGTQTLLAALEIASGQVVAHVKQRRTSVNFLRFLKDVIEAFPGRELHMILDNLNIHKNETARRWLKRHPRVHFHYTPTHTSWVNLVFLQHFGQAGAIAKRPHLETSAEGVSLELHRAQQPESPALCVDQRTREAAAYYRSDERISSGAPTQTEETSRHPQ